MGKMFVQLISKRKYIELEEEKSLRKGAELGIKKMSNVQCIVELSGDTGVLLGLLRNHLRPGLPPASLKPSPAPAPHTHTLSIFLPQIELDLVSEESEHEQR